MSKGAARKGILVIISAASGAGKSTIIKRVMADDPNCVFAVSHTTRPPRPNEVDGKDYYFINDQDFDDMVKADAFAEWAVVHGNRYGTSFAEIERITAQENDVIFEIDFQGGRALMRRFPEAATIFLLPPSLAEVKQRLIDRGTDTDEVIARRMEQARIEIATAGEYRYLVFNDDLDEAVAEVQAILRAERLRSIRFPDKIRELVAEP
ncbi:MAG: guanylate kinase [Myxococcota bacterium]|nr:guanylate kinase [Myxococcota bacterium]MBP8970435.1 guanylate kinase [Myxococcota bacterium]HHW97089.1 guanylate kinase [Oligoflexales bacterium]HQC43843.1 guanylate kinase [Myxococcota bacterium]HQL56054.1 guanylate kinase [Myxococcota bacterium]